MAHHLTRKSFKSTVRDRPKHSGKIGAVATTPRRHGVGRGNVGVIGCELLPDEIDPHDPNFDAIEHAADTVRFAKLRYDAADVAHLHSGVTRFTSTLRDYATFKACVRDSATEYLVSRDFTEFLAASHLQSGTFALFHQDVPFILIKHSFELNDEDRVHIEALLLHLYRANHIQRTHVDQSFRRLYSALPDLLVDVPHARHVLHLYAQFFLAQHMISADAVDESEQLGAYLTDADTMKRLKAEIAAAIDDFFALSNPTELVHAVDRLTAAHGAKSTLVVCIQLVKALVSRALDLTPRDRQLVSSFLATQIASAWLHREHVEAGMSVLLERVEDLSLDVPDVLGLLACFLARAVVDEVLAPAFLVRADLLARDMGAQVLDRAQWMLKQEHAAERLANVWLDDDTPLPSPSQSARSAGAPTSVTAAAAEP